MRTLFTFGLILFSFFLCAQEVQFSFEKQKLLLGEQMRVGMESSITPGESIDFFMLDTLPHFEVLEKSKIDSNTVNGRIMLSQTLLVTSWDSGRWPLPTLFINGVPSKPINIDVAYTSPWDPKQPYHDIKGIIPVKNPGRSTWWWYVIGAAVLVALFMLFFPGGKKEKGENVLDSNAYKKAMQELEKLEKERADSTDAKPYYTKLINIFRTYLKAGKGIQSFSKTTDDLAIQLKTIKMSTDQYNELLQTLRLSDLVKFAQYKPGTQTNTEAFNTIKQSITAIEQSNAV